MGRLTKRHPNGVVGISECRYYNYNDFQKIAKKLADYEDIGTDEEFRELKEKATAKKPIKTYYSGMPTFLCPVCEEEVCEGQKFCDECGQAVMKLDWSEEKE